MGHSRIVGAPPTLVWDELYRVTMSALPLGRALEGVNPWPEHLSRRDAHSGLLSERPGVVISAGLSQAWRLLGGVTPPQLGAAALRAWSQPGWIKVGMEFRLQSTPLGTLLSTETRVLATDPRTRRAFTAYWLFIRAGSGAIRREVLRIVGHRAESARNGR